jgi:nucleoside-diphosphate-sugar epimerase
MRVFIAGGTGYMGRSLIPRLLAAGHEVITLARPGSELKLPTGCATVNGNAFDDTTFVDRIERIDAYVHLVGVAHPGPGKERQFREIDRVSLGASVRAATGRVRNFVYVSVAQPAPAMRAYQSVRAACERIIRESGLQANILRPRYVLGPGHRWPYALLPFYKLCELIPTTRAGAIRLGLVRLPQMIAALAWAVENPADGVRVIDVPMIRRLSH